MRLINSSTYFYIFFIKLITKIILGIKCKCGLRQVLLTPTKNEGYITNTMFQYDFIDSLKYFTIKF